LRAISAFLPLILAAFPALASSSAASGGAQLHADASIDLRIIVPRVLRMRLLDHPSTIEVTREDVQNGVVIVDGPRLELASNDPRGYWLDAQLRGPFAEATIEGLRAPMHIAASGGRVLMPSMVGERRPGPYRLRYELRLREGTPPGVYRWPVMLSMDSP
jgi:hypothetical protein